MGFSHNILRLRTRNSVLTGVCVFGEPCGIGDTVAKHNPPGIAEQRAAQVLQLVQRSVMLRKALRSKA
jgi:hypothetical protein